MTDTNALSLPTDVANTSYPVDLNIPASCAKYRIELVNNVANLVLKSGLTTRMLNGKITAKTIFDDAKKIVIDMSFTPDQGYLYNYILDRADVNIDELTEALDKAHAFFTEYEISRHSQNFIDKYIAGLGRYEKTWHGLTSKPDYNLTLFRGRILPYFNIECKDWVKANIEALKGDYPSELIRASMKTTGANGADDYKDEAALANRNNNFLEWNVLPIDKYPNLTTLVNRILTFNKLGLTTQAYSMLLRLMISPKECHIVRSPEIWKWLNPIMTANVHLEEIIRHCYCYSMYILRQEETVMFSQVNLKYRVLFSLEEASALPLFSTAHIDKSPYILQLTDGTPLSQTIPFYLNGKRSINNKEEFDRRFHIATGGVFKGVDLRAIGAAITGSILIPCVQKSPLENGFEDLDWVRERDGITLSHPYMIDTPITSQDLAFANFLEYYYPSYVSLTDEEYKKQVLGEEKKPAAHVSKALHDSDDEADSIHYEDGSPNDVPIVPVEESKSAKVVRKLKKERRVPRTGDDSVDPDTDTDSDVSETKSQKEDNAVDQVVDAIKQAVDEPPTQDTGKTVNGNKVLLKSESENKTQRIGVDYNQLADIDISITTRDQETFKTRALALYAAICANCNHRGPVHIKEIKTLASIKYKIYGPGISRPMDIFRIPYDPAKMVKKFHVHAVKMFYDNDVTMFRSCIACLLSGVGESYKWFSCNKVAADVLLKYAQRGFSIILNERERTALSKYITESDRWGSMLKTLDIHTEKIYCSVMEKHPFFRPGLYDCGCRKGLRNFEPDTSNIYPNSLVVSKPKMIFPYGEVRFKDTKKVYPPSIQLITSALDYTSNEGVFEEVVEETEDIDEDD
jgi:hypothetical protein